MTFTKDELEYLMTLCNDQIEEADDILSHGKPNYDDESIEGAHYIKSIAPGIVRKLHGEQA